METREEWRIDPESSTLRFAVRHKVLGQLRGQFECWGGQILLDRADPTRSSVRIWVDLSSIDTGSRARDELILRTPLFDVRCEPALTFDSEHLDIDDERNAAVVGALTLQSIRKRVVVEIQVDIPRGEAVGAPGFRGTARASISRFAFGLGKPRGFGNLLSDAMLGDQIDVLAEIEATRATSSLRVSIPVAAGPRESSLPC